MNNYQDYNNFYNDFEKKFKEMFSPKFNEYEHQRKKANLSYKITSFVFFALLPIIAFCITVHLNLLLIVTIVLLLSVMIFSIFLKETLFQVIPLVSIFVVAFLVYYKLDFLVGVFYVGLFIAADIFFFLQYKAKCNRNFMNKIKKQNMSAIVESAGNIKWYGSDFDKVRTSQVIPDFTIRNSGLFMSYNTRYIDDEFKGIYKDVPFEISETKLYNINRSRKATTKMKIFQGVIINFKINKTVKDRTIVSTKHNKTKQSEFLIAVIGCVLISILFIVGWSEANLLWKIMTPVIIIALMYSIFLAYKKQKEKFKKINLEDSEFSKKYDVYSSDQIESRYLLTPSFMERFKNIQTSFGAKIIKCSFYEDNLMIAITTNKNLFEIGSLFKSFNDPESMKLFFSELESVYKMVEYFKLDEKTGI